MFRILVVGEAIFLASATHILKPLISIARYGIYFSLMNAVSKATSKLITCIELRVNLLIINSSK